MSNVTMLIYLKSRKNSKNENPIYLRLTVNGKRKEISMNRSIDSNKFDKNKATAEETIAHLLANKDRLK